MTPLLRPVVDADLDAFYEQQADPEASAMAVFPSRDRAAFDEHWRRIRTADSVVNRTIDVDGEVAGYVASWEADGKRFLGYWLGREFWGRGLATAALAAYVEEVQQRPLYAWVARSNVGSVRVLEKCAFELVEERAEHDEYADRVVPELLFELR